MRTTGHPPTPTGPVVHFAARNAALLALLVAGVMSGCGGPRSRPATDPRSDAPLSAEELEIRVAELAQRAQTEPEEPYWPLRTAELYARAGAPAEARRFLEAALAIDPDYAPALSQLCRLHYQAGEHAAAIERLEASRARRGTAFPTPLATGLALHYQALEDEAAAGLFAQLESSPEVHGALAYHLLASDGFLGAHRWAESAVRAAPESAVNRNNLGITFLYEGQPDEARREFERALALDPELPGPMYNLAIVEHFYFFDPDAGRDWLHRYLQRSDYDPDGLQEIFAEEAAR